MKNGENLRSLSNEALGSFLCHMLEQALERVDVFCRDVCPVSDLCYRGHNGFVAWLDREQDPETEPVS